MLCADSAKEKEETPVHIAASLRGPSKDKISTTAHREGELIKKAKLQITF